jgi:hypothetical protein
MSEVSLLDLSLRAKMVFAMRNHSLNYDLLVKVNILLGQQDHLQNALKAFRGLLSEKYQVRVLELGCGACHWLAGLCVPDPFTFAGIDKPHEML